MDLIKFHQENKDSEISWVYMWGKLVDKDIFFHAAQFIITDKGKSISSYHSSIHSKEKGSKYSEYVENNHKEIGLHRERWLYTDMLRVYVFSQWGMFGGYGVYILGNSDADGHTVEPNEDIVGYFKLGEDWEKCTPAIAKGWVERETRITPWGGLIYEEENTLKVNNWECVAIKLDDGRDIVVCKKDKGFYGSLIQKNKSIFDLGLPELEGWERRPEHMGLGPTPNDTMIEDFTLLNNMLLLPELDLKLTLIPVTDEVIFHPDIGMKYSEQPVKVLGDGISGYGMRERTYGGL